MKRHSLILLLPLLLAVLTAKAQTYRYTGPAGDEKTIDITVVGAVPSADYYTAMSEARLKRQWPGGLTMRMDSLMKDPLLESIQLGLSVYDLTDERPLYRHGERQMMRPASTMKILTSITALTTLPDNYRYRTEIYLDGNISGGTLDGDIYCVGGMDPMITYDDLLSLARQIADKGVKRIRGRIMADKSMKDEEEEFGEGWCWDDKNPTLSPLLYGKRDEFLSQFAKALRRTKIDVKASLANGRLPKEKATLLCSVERRIDEVMVDMMKESDNLFAESMFYQIAAEEVRHPITKQEEKERKRNRKQDDSRLATAKTAARVVAHVIDSIMPYEATYRIADGSGLSLYNYVTADIETEMLRYAYHNKAIYDRLLPTLPIAGIDGTLERRMTSGREYANVRAKTGTLTGIYSLAGYCTASNGHTIAFAILTQGSMTGRPARDFIDKICHLLCDYYE